MANTKLIKTTALQPGNIVHFYGARFEVLSVQMHTVKNDAAPGCGFALSSKAKWLDGMEVRGYFGKGTDDWNFQGNDLATVSVEVH